MYREICVLKMLEFSINPDSLLEGEGVTVEIDKSKFGIRNYHIGRKTPEVPNRALPIPVPNRTRERSFPIIQMWIKPGIPHALNLCTTVISDGWASYLGLDQIRHLHLLTDKTGQNIVMIGRCPIVPEIDVNLITTDTTMRNVYIKPYSRSQMKA
ncbi:hypothetical protein RF11_02985 [Thelohanellus kitauei]|uniref:ISXO2-like transposase domain-containing protein n=1 Tax=Thelohanellus kitauei TaxID=669202 RepID=A0A0C2N5E3_THEKT|nr:hypothetical protein RF11_02985 [Thelohanellus kitauei]